MRNLIIEEENYHKLTIIAIKRMLKKEETTLETTIEQVILDYFENSGNTHIWN